MEFIDMAHMHLAPSDHLQFATHKNKKPMEFSPSGCNLT